MMATVPTIVATTAAVPTIAATPMISAFRLIGLSYEDSVSESGDSPI